MRHHSGCGPALRGRGGPGEGHPHSQNCCELPGAGGIQRCDGPDEPQPAPRAAGAAAPGGAEAAGRAAGPPVPDQPPFSLQRPEHHLRPVPHRPQPGTGDHPGAGQLLPSDPVHQRALRHPGAGAVQCGQLPLPHRGPV